MNRLQELNLQKQYNVKESEIFVLRYDESDQFLAIGFNDGTIQLIQEDKNTHLLNTGESPITSLRWRPEINKTKGILISTNADGLITHWHAPSGKKLHEITEDNSTLCLDFNLDGSQFATAGKDFQIRIYDDSIKSISHTFQAADWGQRGHSNRIFSVKFLPDQPDVLVSGGWDANILLWDIREKKCIGQFYGPSLAGDSLDYSEKNQMLLTGSYRTSEQIQLWDIRTFKLFKEIVWEEETKPVYIYAAQFNKFNPNYIHIGSSGVHEFRVFNIKDGSVCASLPDLQRSVLTFDQMNLNKNVALSGAEGLVNVYEISTKRF